MKNKIQWSPLILWSIPVMIMNIQEWGSVIVCDRNEWGEQLWMYKWDAPQTTSTDPMHLVGLVLWCREGDYIYYEGESSICCLILMHNDPVCTEHWSHGVMGGGETGAWHVVVRPWRDGWWWGHDGVMGGDEAMVWLVVMRQLHNEWCKTAEWYVVMSLWCDLWWGGSSLIGVICDETTAWQSDDNSMMNGDVLYRVDLNDGNSGKIKYKWTHSFYF